MQVEHENLVNHFLGLFDLTLVEKFYFALEELFYAILLRKIRHIDRSFLHLRCFLGRGFVINSRNSLLGFLREDMN